MIVNSPEELLFGVRCASVITVLLQCAFVGAVV
jgi:hypothetical protein